MSTFRTMRAVQRNNKIAGVTAVIEALCRQQKSISVDTHGIENWLDSHLQTVQRRACECLGVGQQTLSSVAQQSTVEGTQITYLQSEEDRIGHLRVRELREELSHAGESTCGKKADLQKRLIQVMRARFHSQQEQKKKDESTQNAEVCEQMQIEPVEQPLETHCEQEITDIDMKSVVDEPQQPTILQVEQECSIDVAMSEEAETVKEVVKDAIMTDATTPSTGHKVSTSLETKVAQLSPKTQTVATPANENNHSERKRSRSPLRAAQSVFTKLSPNRSQTKVPKLANAWPPSTSKPTKEDRVTASTDNENGGIFSPTRHVKEASSSLSASRNQLLSKNKPLGTASGASAPLGQSSSKLLSAATLALSTSKDSGSSVLKEAARKRNEERKARLKGRDEKEKFKQDRLAEIRAKSKAIPVNKGLESSGTVTQTFSTFKCAGKQNDVKGEQSSTYQLSQQMREKAKIGTTPKAHFLMSQNKPNSSSTFKPPSSATSVHKSVPVFKDAKTSPVPVKRSPKKSPLLSPLDSYEISDGEVDEDSDDEEVRERRAKKHVPSWARTKNLKVILDNQFRRTDVHPDNIFGQVTTCDLDAIFEKQSNKCYQSRTSTGDWGNDMVKPHEQLINKRSVYY